MGMFFKFIAVITTFWFTAAHADDIDMSRVQDCTQSALKLARHDMAGSLERYLNTTNVTANAHPSWRTLSKSQQRNAEKTAEAVMVRSLKQYGFGLWFSTIDAESITRINSNLFRIKGKVTVLLLFGQPFTAEIDSSCRVQQIHLLTKDRGWRSLSQWLAEQDDWPQ